MHDGSMSLFKIQLKRMVDLQYMDQGVPKAINSIVLSGNERSHYFEVGILNQQFAFLFDAWKSEPKI